jgi:hypothetical protein
MSQEIKTLQWISTSRAPNSLSVTSRKLGCTTEQAIRGLAETYHTLQHSHKVYKRIKIQQSFFHSYVTACFLLDT